MLTRVCDVFSVSPAKTPLVILHQHLFISFPIKARLVIRAGIRTPLDILSRFESGILTQTIDHHGRVDRLDAIRLLKALVAAGAKPREPMNSAWIDKIAVRDVSLHGTQLASALAYAEGQRWLADSQQETTGFTSLVRVRSSKESVI